MNKFLLIYFGLIFSIVAQDNLLDLIDDGPLEKYPVSATFKATRIVNAQSIELARPKTLEFMIQHRFGSLKNGLILGKTTFKIKVADYEIEIPKIVRDNIAKQVDITVDLKLKKK